LLIVQINHANNEIIQNFQRMKRMVPLAYRSTTSGKNHVLK